MQTLWQDARAYVRHLCERIFVDIGACALELCTRACADGEVRVHMHVYLQKNDRNITVSRASVLAFKGVLPHINAHQASRGRG
eukprot:6059673-Lingulodinium_polyedra.AAC.1